MSVLNVCSFCSMPADLRCSGCQNSFYCSKEHQKRHWKSHKTQCKPFKVLETKDMGRVLVATRDLKQGELVLSEQPVVVAPMPNVNSICVGCYVFQTKLQQCKRCGWPVCGEACSSLPSHLPECTMTQEHLLAPLDTFNELTNGQGFVLILELLAVLRLLFLKREDDVYKRISHMEDHSEARRRVGKLQRDRALLEIARHTLRLDSRVFSDWEFVHACGTLFVNGHELPATSTSTCPCFALYLDASLLEHSCLNNASKHFRATSLQIRAAVSVGRNDHLKISYSDPMWSTRMRQMQLKETKFFTCNCLRCRDPIELGTHFSSIRCFRCPLEDATNAYLLPPSSSSSRKWVCMKCECSEDAAVVDRVVSVISGERERLLADDIDSQLAFISKHERVLHPNHHILVDTKLVLCQMIDKGDHQKKKTSKLYRLKRRLCEDVLAVVNVLNPGVSRLRALVLYELQSARLESLKHEQESPKLDDMERKRVLKELKDISSQLLECSVIFGFESPDIAEGRLAVEAERRSRECKEMFEVIQRLEKGDNVNHL